MQVPASGPLGRHARPGSRAWTPATVRAALIAVLGLLTLAGWWWWQGRPLPIEAVSDGGASVVPTASPVVAPPADPGVSDVVTVHVLGRIERPGVYRLPRGARVEDAITAAGGLRRGARARGLNLARVLVDGEQLLVGRPGAATSAATGGAPVSPGAEGASAPLDLNRASAAELEALPGIGPVIAARIVSWREANGAFPAVEVLAEVPGIGPVLLERLRPLVTI